MKRNLWKILATLVVLSTLIAGCATATPETIKEVVTQVVEVEKEVTRIVAGTPVFEKVVETKIVEKEVVVEKEKVVTATPETKAKMTDLGTPRNDTLVVQTFDTKSPRPDLHNPLMDYDLWRGFRELAWGYLWEIDTGTGERYPEVAAEMPEPLNDEYTKFRITLKEGIYWSDGVEFTADDVIYTLDTIFRYRDKLTNFGVPAITSYVKEGGWKKIGDYTLEVETVNPAYDFAARLGVSNWGSWFKIVPKHVFEQQEDVSTFRNTHPVTLGPYTVKEFDPSGFWILWERREDWKRSAWGWMDKDGYIPQYILYKYMGPEETRTMAFVLNEYDVDTFMSPESIKACQSRNEYITTFSGELPYHNMDDAAEYGLLMNLQKPPFDKLEVRWGLALSLDLKSVAINALSGEVKVTPLAMTDTPILRPVYFEPLLPWLREFELPDGYKPFDENFVPDLVARLKEEVGVSESELPQGEEALSEAFGFGWWKYDPEEAEKLFNSVGITKNADGNYVLPDGTLWEPELVTPGEWNKVMQRLSFSIADSWRESGIQAKVRQVDNAEWGVVYTTNAQREMIISYSNANFSTNYLRDWRNLRVKYVQPADATEPNSGNVFQWENETVDALVEQATHLPQASEEFYEIGRSILKEFVKDMAYLAIMDIPTTIPTNEYYWTNFPKADNYYAVPYTWWSEFRETVVNVKPTGRQ